MSKIQFRVLFILGNNEGRYESIILYFFMNSRSDEIYIHIFDSDVQIRCQLPDS